MTAKAFLVIRTAPTLAIMGAFSSRPKADAFVKAKGLSACIVEEWNVT